MEAYQSERINGQIIAVANMVKMRFREPVMAPVNELPQITSYSVPPTVTTQ